MLVDHNLATLNLCRDKAPQAIDLALVQHDRFSGRKLDNGVLAGAAARPTAGILDVFNGRIDRPPDTLGDFKKSTVEVSYNSSDCFFAGGVRVALNCIGMHRIAE
ncbi:hypothetical protein DMC63_06820 [Streptomyces sp. WAC 05977]|nr:hypothetical protein DMC63_06820 [Streptomyces sp. WAC 05977]